MALTKDDPRVDVHRRLRQLFPGHRPGLVDLLDSYADHPDLLPALCTYAHEAIDAYLADRRRLLYETGSQSPTSPADEIDSLFEDLASERLFYANNAV